MVVLTQLYGTPGKIDEIRKICNVHGALPVEDAAENFGATYKGVETGSLGDYDAITLYSNNVLERLRKGRNCNKVTENAA